MNGDLGKIILVSGRPKYASFAPMTLGLADGFQALGVETDVVWIEEGEFDQDAFLARIRTWDAAPPRAVLCWNAKLDLRPDGVSIHDRLGIPLIDILVDHPATHAPLLRRLPRNHITTYLDRGHREYLDHAMPGARVVFLPHGGPKPLDPPPPMAERPIRVLLSGNFHAAGDIRETLARVLGRPRDEGLDRAADAMLARVMDAIEDPFRAAMTELSLLRNPPPPEERWLMAETLTAPICAMVSNEHRIRFLNELGDVPATVIGEIHPDAKVPRRDGIDYLGPKGFEEILALLPQTRILANVIPYFSDGSHERVFYGMAAGCVLASTPSRYLAEDFKDGESILYHQAGDAGLSERVAAILTDAPKADAMARAALAAYAPKHTWGERARVLAGVLEAFAEGSC